MNSGARDAAQTGHKRQATKTGRHVVGGGALSPPFAAVLALARRVFRHEVRATEVRATVAPISVRPGLCP